MDGLCSPGQPPIFLWAPVSSTVIAQGLSELPVGSLQVLLREKRQDGRCPTERRAKDDPGVIHDSSSC